MRRSADTTHAATIAALQNHSLPSLVQDQLERMILAGQFVPGSQLPESPLAAKFGVSRGPVREALRGLEEKGLVRVEKNRGVFVRTISAREAHEIYEVRIALEELIVKKLAAAPDVVRAAKLEDLLAKTATFARKGDFAQCHARNVEFHDRLAALTGNAKLVESYRRLVGELSLFRLQAHARVPDASSLRASVADHRAVLRALVEGDGRAAIRLLRAHVEASRERLQNLLANEEQATK
jgi:phosphonate utilization transcriptional regulator